MVDPNGGKSKVSSDSADELFGLWADDWNLGDMGRRFMTTNSPPLPTDDAPVTRADSNIQFNPVAVFVNFIIYFSLLIIKLLIVY